MNEADRMTREEFIQMIQLLKRYATTEMDQWELWKFDTNRSKIYVDISMIPSTEGTEEAYTDLNHVLSTNKA